MVRAALAIAFLGAAAAAARAQAPSGELPEVVEARRHFDAGQARFEAGDYRAAIEEFRVGYAIEQKRVFLYALAQAERLAGDCAAAVPHYEAFLRTNPPPEMASHAEKGMAGCPQTPRTPLPESQPASLPAAPPPPPRPPPPPPARPFWQDPLGDALVIGGVVALGVGVGFSAAARSSASAADRADSLAEYEDFAVEARGRRRIAAVSLGAGVALAAAGVVRWVLIAREPEPAAPAVSFVDGGALVGLAGRF
jgi:hypothetical protein